jgi:hypothetical protein
MTWKQAGIIRQVVDLCFDAPYQGIRVAARQVSAADTVQEDQVAAEAQADFGCAGNRRNIKDAVTFCMPGCVADFQMSAAELQDLTLVQIDCRFGARIDPEAKEWRPTLGAPEAMIGRMQGNQRQRVEAICNRSCAADMVKVSVCIPEMPPPIWSK